MATRGTNTRVQEALPLPAINHVEQPQIRYVRAAGGIHIAYYSMGDGPPLVVTSEIQWSHLGYTLGLREAHRSRSGKGVGRGLRIVRYDARGSGLSDREPLDFSWEARRADLEAVVDALGLDRFALLGHRNGCLTAIPYAAEFPERVSHLVLVCPYVRGWEHPTLSNVAGVTPLHGMSKSQWEHYTEAVAQLVTGYSSPQLAQVIACAYRDSMTPEAFLAFLAYRGSIDLGPYLERITVPTLVIQRRFADSPPLELEVAERIAQARLVSIDAPGPIRERWRDEETEAVEEFLGVHHERPRTESALTPREVEVLTLIARGYSNRQIAEDLVLSERTVARHVANIYQRLNIHGRAGVTAFALRHRLI
jgi:pimeloyl-ACP methyl ester carboxylesterase/DNA-binding CsgD family transcriptional regulator